MRFDQPTPRLLSGAILLALVLAGPAEAATARKAKPKPVAAAPAAPPPPPPAAEAEKSKGDDPKPVTERPVTAGDVIATPVSDLNLKKTDIPPLLISAQGDPYSLAGLKRCYEIGEAIVALDTVLGDDLDLPQDGRANTSAGSVAQAAVGAFIPFRGVIREISGANEHERKLREAIVAGTARRAFLKGYGQAKGCKYPARAITPAVLAARDAAAGAGKADDKGKKDDSRTKSEEKAKPEDKAAKPVKPVRKKKKGKQPEFVSEPVVQKID